MFSNKDMIAYLKDQTIAIAKALLACAPWLIAMYLLFWMEKTDTWTSETPLRDPLSVCVVAVGMLSSLFVYTNLFAGNGKKAE
ncbi:MAG: hypothetical protein AB8B48_02970 [Pseudomonadales bacterium]